MKRMSELYQGLSGFFRKYNARKHQTLGMSPEQKYREGLAMRDAALFTSSTACVASQSSSTTTIHNLYSLDIHLELSQTTPK